MKAPCPPRGAGSTSVEPWPAGVHGLQRALEVPGSSGGPPPRLNTSLITVYCFWYRGTNILDIRTRPTALDQNRYGSRELSGPGCTRSREPPALRAMRVRREPRVALCGRRGGRSSSLPLFAISLGGIPVPSAPTLCPQCLQPHCAPTCRADGSGGNAGGGGGPRHASKTHCKKTKHNGIF